MTSTVSLVNKKCIVCQSDLKKADYPNTEGYSSFRSSPTIAYACSLLGVTHYVAYLDEAETKIEEEKVKLFLNNKEHEIVQYWDDNDLVITIYDERGKFQYSKCLNMPVLAFDFLNSNLDQIVRRLRTILTFQ